MNHGNSLFTRFLIYQKERYPFVVYFFLISSFSFSAIAYSRICRGLVEFISLDKFIVCIFNTILLFFILRVLDEFKDQEDDKKYRQYLPVPRGLISLDELKYIAIITTVIQVLITYIFFPKMIILLCMVYSYLFLMTKEFFVKEWLKRHQFWYVTSHMLIIPLVDVFASGFDWFLQQEEAPNGLIFFFVVSFMNGLVLEIGRKIKSPEREEPGVLSYTFQLGIKRAILLWVFLLFVTWIFAFIAANFAGHTSLSYILLSVAFIGCSVPAVLFFNRPNNRNAKMIEISSGIWTFSMYLILGGIPMILSLLQ